MAAAAAATSARHTDAPRSRPLRRRRRPPRDASRPNRATITQLTHSLTYVLHPASRRRRDAARAAADSAGLNHLQSANDVEISGLPLQIIFIDKFTEAAKVNSDNDGVSRRRHGLAPYFPINVSFYQQAHLVSRCMHY